MRPARLFSTTTRTAKQQLYEPFVRPLNQEQRKAIRKEILKTLPVFHGEIKRDIATVLERFTVDEERAQQRTELRQSLTETVQKKFGDQYVVRDIGMRRYSLDLYDAPFEFAVVDTERKTGLPDLENAPPVYDPITLALTLQDSGFYGGFPSSDHPSLLSPPPQPPPTPEPEIHPPTTPWPTLHRRARTELVVPTPVLGWAPTPFSLLPPSPDTLPFVELLRQYQLSSPSLSHLTALAWLWAKSHGLHQVLPSTIAVMAIFFAQTHHHLSPALPPSLPQTPKPKPKPTTPTTQPSPDTWLSEFYLPARYIKNPLTSPESDEAWTTEAYRLDTGLPPPSFPIRRERRLAPFFHGFLEYWGSSPPLLSHQIFSPRTGTLIPRTHRKLSPRDTSWEAIDAQSLKMAKKEGGFDPWKEPPSWVRHAIVVQNPVVPTHNLTALWSRSTLSAFTHKATLSSGLLARGHPLMATFGPYLALPRGRLERQRGEGKSAGAGAGRPRTIDGQRGYHTTARRLGGRGRSRSQTQESIADDVERAFSLLRRSHDEQQGARRAKNPNRNHHSTPPPHQHDADRRRSQTLRRVERAVNDAYGATYRVSAFGSTQYGVASATSDLDMVLIDPDRPMGFAPGATSSKLPPIYTVSKLAQVLRKAGFVNVLSIPKASVPIVKFHDPQTQLNCDINVNDQLGLKNTYLIKRYCALSPLLRPTIIAVKKWAKASGLNNPSGRAPNGKGFSGPPSFSSYALTLMIVGRLQMLGLLPNLQSRLGEIPDVDEEQIFYIRPNKRSSRVLECNAKFNPMVDWEVKEGPGFEEVLADWFRFWGSMFDYKTQLMSIRHGGTVSRVTKAQLREQKMQKAQAVADKDAGGVEKEYDESELGEEQPADWVNYPIVIADPFIRIKNVTQNISPKVLEKFVNDCRRVVQHLEWGYGLNDIIDEPPVGKAKATKWKTKAEWKVVKEEVGADAEPEGKAKAEGKVKAEVKAKAEAKAVKAEVEADAKPKVKAKLKAKAKAKAKAKTDSSPKPDSKSEQKTEQVSSKEDDVDGPGTEGVDPRLHLEVLDGLWEDFELSKVGKSSKRARAKRARKRKVETEENGADRGTGQDRETEPRAKDEPSLPSSA